MRRIEFSRAARQDLTSVLSRSEAAFGGAARRRYEHLIQTPLEDLARNPETPGSRSRDELQTGARTYHLRLSRIRARLSDGAVGSPRHLIVYRYDAERIFVARLLHDAMDLARHLPPEL